MHWFHPLVLSVVMAFNLYVIFGYAPLERTMGIVQKIFYFHVASAWIGFLAFLVVFVGSICYLRTRQTVYDRLATASAEIGTLFTTMVLVTGPLWARPVWNTWWTWDARLTSTLVMWFMYLAYIILQHSVPGEQRPRLAAVYGIAAFVNVPLVFFSIRWWRSLHPVVIAVEGGGITPAMGHALVASLFTFLLVYVYLLRYRMRIMDLEQQTKDILHFIYTREES